MLSRVWLFLVQIKPFSIPIIDCLLVVSIDNPDLKSGGSTTLSVHRLGINYEDSHCVLKVNTGCSTYFGPFCSYVLIVPGGYFLLLHIPGFSGPLSVVASVSLVLREWSHLQNSVCVCVCVCVYVCVLPESSFLYLHRKSSEMRQTDQERKAKIY